MVKLIEANINLVNDWEFDFFENVKDRNELTVRQEEMLRKLYERILG